MHVYNSDQDGCSQGMTGKLRSPNRKSPFTFQSLLRNKLRWKTGQVDLPGKEEVSKKAQGKLLGQCDC